MEPFRWADSFNVFIGSTLLDRIHFWNARHFTPSYAASLGSIILEPGFFNDLDLVTQLGQIPEQQQLSQPTSGSGKGVYTKL